MGRRVLAWVAVRILPLGTVMIAWGLRVHVLEELDVLALVQEWASWDDLERYLRTEDRRKLVAVMELATQRPEVWFDTIGMREGLECLARVLPSR